MTKLLIANWKNSGNIKQIELYLQELSETPVSSELIIALPYIYMYIYKLANIRANIKLAAQDICMSDDESFTSAVSPSSLVELGCSYVIIGHSECRSYLLQDDAVLVTKLKMANKYKLKPIYCVGESEHASAKDIASYLYKQLNPAISFATQKEIIIAYEPLWAIGSGSRPNFEYLYELFELLSTKLKSVGCKFKLAYGGSISDDNYSYYLINNKLVDALLIGRAALHSNKLLNLAKSIKNDF